MADPTPLTASQRKLRAEIAAHTRWMHTPDRSAATKPARDGLERKFEDLVDLDRTLDPATRAKLVANAKSQHYKRLAYKSAQARKRAAS